MTRTRVPDYLNHMLDAARQACSYVDGLTTESFLGDKKTQQAVVLNLILIGEEATKLLKDHEAFAMVHPNLPLRSMKGMRNRIAQAISRSISTPFGIPSKLRCPC